MGKKIFKVFLASAVCAAVISIFFVKDAFVWISSIYLAALCSVTGLTIFFGLFTSLFFRQAAEEGQYGKFFNIFLFVCIGIATVTLTFVFRDLIW